MPRKRATKAQQEQRLGIVLELIARGTPKSHILQLLEQKEGITSRQARNYLDEAHGVIAGLGLRASAFERGLLVKRLESLLYQAHQEKDYQLALQILKQQGEILKITKGGQVDEISSLRTTSPSAELESAIQALEKESKANESDYD